MTQPTQHTFYYRDDEVIQEALDRQNWSAMPAKESRLARLAALLLDITNCTTLPYVADLRRSSVLIWHSLVGKVQTVYIEDHLSQLLVEAMFLAIKYDNKDAARILALMLVEVTK